jgi:D-beta-D-heptose 7-phosphate kinase/D-beta-D-heptose 1-phosphate adenosyltransferase
VVGDVMLDRYLTGAVDRISPEAPVPVLRVEGEHAAPGGAANVAAGIAALGASCDLVSVVGADVDAEELTTLLGRSAGVRLDLLQDPERPTTVKTRVLARHQQMLRVDRESTGPLPESVRERVKRRVLDRLEEASAVALVDYDKGVLGSDWVAEILDAASRRGVPAVVDPKLRNFFSFRGAFLFKPNGRELAAAIGAERPPQTRAELAAVRDRLRCRHLLVTLGEHGMALLAEGEETLRHIPSRAREVYDVSGAGDTVTAVLAALLAAGADVGEAAVLANVAAGVEVSHLGAVPVRGEELLAALEEAHEAPERSRGSPGR